MVSNNTTGTLEQKKTNSFLLKSGGLHFFFFFGHKEIMGWTSGFSEITETSSAH